MDVEGGEEDVQNKKEEEAVKNKQGLGEKRGGGGEGGGCTAMPASPFSLYRVAW